MRAGFAWRYAARSLARGGQRTVLAIFCIAVGILAIVALQLVGLSVNDAITSNIIEANGGDLRADSILAPFQQKDLGVFTRLQSQGQISAYATTYETPSLIQRANGDIVPFDLVEASPNFPLVGQADFTSPGHDLRMQDVVQGNRVALNAYVAAQLGARIGDTYEIKTGDGQAVPVIVAAIFQDGGAFHGPQVVISQATVAATLLPNGTRLPMQFTTVTLTAPAATLDSVKAQLRQQFPSATVTTAQDELRLRQQDVASIRLFLRIVGLLALFIGGVGVINTMQVLLRRRRVEIAMLKTMGFRQGDLLRLFGLEAALLGLLGSVLGVGLGVAAAEILRSIVEQAFFLHLVIPLDPITLLSGMLIGVPTALIFGLLPIVQASRVRPIGVLRDDAGATRSSLATRAGMLALLAALFVALASSIVQNLLAGTLVIAGGAVTVALLAGGFSALIALIARLPIFERPNWRVILWVMPAALVLAGIVAGIAVVVGQLQHVNVLAFTSGLPRDAQIELGLAALGLLLGGGAVIYFLATLAQGVVMFAPRAWKTAVMLAFRNLGRQRGRSTATLTALFAGVFSIGIIVVLGQGIQATIDSTIATLFAHNVFVVTAPGQESQVQAALVGAPGVQVASSVSVVVARVRPVAVRGIPFVTLLNLAGNGATSGDIVHRDTLALTLGIAEGYPLAGGGAQDVPGVAIDAGRNLTAADAGTANVVVNDILRRPPASLHVGETIVEADLTGSATRTLVVVGFFSRARTTDLVPGEIIGDTGTIAPLGGILQRDLTLLKVPANQVPALRQHLATLLPSAQVISISDISQIFDRVLNNLIVMLSAIASLALIAGLIIIANAVALAMLERRREIGILKSVGHTSRSVLAMVLIENGLTGILSALVAMVLVIGVITGISLFLFHVAIVISGPLVGAIIGGTTLVVMLVALLVAWSATRLRPLEVLRYE